jgi:hypothetical protein
MRLRNSRLGLAGPTATTTAGSSRLFGARATFGGGWVLMVGRRVAAASTSYRKRGVFDFVVGISLGKNWKRPECQQSKH